jgi:hypothetical protein
MRFRSILILTVALICITPIVAAAQLTSYSQNFEDPGVVATDRFALTNDGWLVYGNVYDPSGTYLYGYGPFDAPNSSANGVPDAFCGVATGEGGAAQGDQQLSVFSDYQNGDHANGNLVESNVYHEMTIDSTDVGTTWFFEFDVKHGDLISPSTAVAFIKTLDPNDGYTTTNFIQSNTTIALTEWRRYALTITIDSSLAGQILQFGFANTTTSYFASGIFYDNIEFTQTASLGVGDGPTASAVGLRVLANPVIGNAAQVLSFNVPRNGRVTVRVFDVSGRLVATLLDRNLPEGSQEAVWDGRRAGGGSAVTGIYFAEVVAGNERAVAKLIRSR